MRADGASEVLRARALVAFSLGLATVATAFALFDVVVGDLPLAVPLGMGALLSLGVLGLFRKTGSFALAANLAAAAAWVTLVGNAALNDGLEPPALMFLGIVPACALLFGGVVPGAVWLVLSLVAVVGFFVAEEAGFPFWQTMAQPLVRGNRALVVAALATFPLLAFHLQDVLRQWLVDQLHEAGAVNIRRIIDAAGDGILVVDPTGRILIANLAAGTLLDRVHLVGHRLEQLVDGADGSRDRAG